MEKTNKNITDHHHHHHNSNTNNNWLGFSLSSSHHFQSSSSNNNNMDVASEPSDSRAVTAFLHAPPPPHPQHFNFPPICYGENDGTTFCHPMTVMPLKSDGSLYLMDDFSTTQSHHQGMGTSSTPTMGLHHHHHQHHHEPIALSLDMSMYYNHNESNGQECFNHSLNKQIETHIADSNNIHLQNWVTGTTNNGGSGSGSVSDQMMLQNGGQQSGSMGYGHDFQSLSLSMSPGSQSSCVTGGGSQLFSSPPAGVNQCLDIVEPSKKRGAEKVDNQKQIVHRKSLDTFGQRTSQYRGVTRHRWTGRYEAHLWDNSCKKEGQSRKGRQVYLGGYDMEEKAARAYDLAALKYWGPATHINFTLENYEKELEEMKNMTRQEYVAHLRRKSSGFSRGASIYRGVTRHHQHGRWQARIGRVAGNKDLYLGTFSTQEEAAEAYDVAAIKFRGVSAVTNFDISKYDVERIMASNTLLAGELARRKKEVVEPILDVNLIQRADESDLKMIISQSSQSGGGRTLTRGGEEEVEVVVEEEEEGISNLEKEQQLQNGNGTYCFSLMRPPPLTTLPHGPLFAAWANAS